MNTPWSPPHPHPDEMTIDQRALYDEIVGGPRSAGPAHFRLTDDDGRLLGPFNGFLLQPAVGQRLQALGTALRFETGLSDRVREITILVVATTRRSDFEWYAHEPIARAAGLTDRQLKAIAAGSNADDDEPDVWPDPGDRAALAVARSLCEHGDADADLVALAVEQFGASGLFEMMTLVGYYSTLAMQLRVLGVSAPRS